MALDWYLSYATPFVKDFNLMVSLIDESGLVGASKKIFLLKLNTIHQTILTLQMRKAKEETKNNG
jgi:hypothetical protein